MMKQNCFPYFYLKMRCFLFFLMAFNFVTITTHAADSVPERCTKCHTEAKIVEKVFKMSVEERSRKLEAFLPNHYTPDASERAAIVATLKALAEKR